MYTYFFAWHVYLCYFRNREQRIRTSPSLESMHIKNILIYLILGVFTSNCIENSIVLEYNQSSISINITLSNIRLKEPIVNAEAVQVVVGSDFRKGILSVLGWNSGTATAKFSSTLTCGPGYYYVKFFLNYLLNYFHCRSNSNLFTTGKNSFPKFNSIFQLHGTIHSKCHPNFKLHFNVEC